MLTPCATNGNIATSSKHPPSRGGACRDTEVFLFSFFGQLADWWRLDLTYLAATGNRSGRLLPPPGVCEELFGSDFNCCRDTQSWICFRLFFFFFLEKYSKDFLFGRRLIFTSATQLSRGRRGRCDTALRQRRGGGGGPVPVCPVLKH